MNSPSVHVLENLEFPARYEALRDRLGPQLASVLVDPGDETKNLFEDAGHAIRANREGIFLPVHAPSGTGKTTLANSLSYFFPDLYTSTIDYPLSQVDAPMMHDLVQKHLRSLPANTRQIVPINIDNRENAPANSAELAEIKRFLRMPETGVRTLIIWPDTDQEVAAGLAQAYRVIAGDPAVQIPVSIQGPSRETWPDIAKNTLRLANSLDSLELLGVNPVDYDPAEHTSIGAYLRKLSADFLRLKMQLIREARVPLRLVVLIASESDNAAVLTHLTNSSRFGLMDATALLDASPDSEIGRWWNGRRGLLTQTILKLDARVFCLPPSASVGIIRQYGTNSLKASLDDIGFRSLGESQTARNLGRTDVGKFLTGNDRSTFETKGTPTTTSLSAFRELGKIGFSSGRDKALNNAMRGAIEAYCRINSITGTVRAEKRMDFAPLIPDNSLDMGHQIVCFEYTWRSSNFLVAKNRGVIAAYCLTKLKNYARELGWLAGNSG